jgi:nucleotide-binding universal stress UspA family protein
MREQPMIKTILVPAMGNETDAASYAAALQIARPFAAHLDALHVRLDPMEVAVAMTSDGSAGLPVGLIEHLQQDVREREAKAQRLFTEFCARETLAVAASPAAGSTAPTAQWHVETGQETSWTAIYGLSSDLIVASRGPESERARASLEGVLLDTGRPLLIPSAAAPSVAMTDRIAIAWKPTPQAARAVAAAMPLLARATEVVVMTVEEEAEGSRDEVQGLLRNLAWHGIAATARRLKPEPHGAAETLLAAAGAEAGLLVMGGYGHNRLREWVFGGFTQRVLVGAPVPVLIAH